MENVGFIKLKTDKTGIDGEMIIKGCNNYSGNLEVSLLIERDRIEKLNFGKINIVRGNGRGPLTAGGITIDKCIGIKGKLDEDSFVASCWKDNGQDLILNFDLEEPVEKRSGEKEPVEKELVKKESDDEKNENDMTIKNINRITLSDIHKFPKRNWYLCNNSFLLHGFFNYNYLVTIERQNNGVIKKYIGVPGVYEKPEKMMATLFGFSEFLPEKELPPSEKLEGVFGYWLCLLDI